MFQYKKESKYGLLFHSLDMSALINMKSSFLPLKKVNLCSGWSSWGSNTKAHDLPQDVVNEAWEVCHTQILYCEEQHLEDPIATYAGEQTTPQFCTVYEKQIAIFATFSFASSQGKKVSHSPFQYSGMM